MKRKGNIAEWFLSYENFDNAELSARKGKKRKDIKRFDEEFNTPEKRKYALMLVSDSIRNGTFVSAAPVTKEKITGRKKRFISTVPYYPDRILHFAIFNVIRDRCKKSFINHMYSYDKGVHELTFNIQKKIRNLRNEPIYILQSDVHKFYDSIDHKKAIELIKKLIKDRVVIRTIEEILTVHGKVLIGMLLSTLISSIYMTPFDRFVTEKIKPKAYYRFADDFCLMDNDKYKLKSAEWRIKNFLWYELGLVTNYTLIYDINKRPLDFCGYVHYKTHTKIRKNTKKKFVKNRNNPKSVASYLGMLKWCNSNNLIYKTLIKNNYAKERGNIRKCVS